MTHARAVAPLTMNEMADPRGARAPGPVPHPANSVVTYLPT